MSGRDLTDRQLGETVVGEHIEGGVDAVSIAAVIEHNTSSLLFENSTGITRPRDLPGHVYGSYDSPLENALISTLVSCDGGDPAGIETAPLATDDFRIGLDAFRDRRPAAFTGR